MRKKRVSHEGTKKHKPNQLTHRDAQRSSVTENYLPKKQKQKTRYITSEGDQLYFS